MQAINDLPKLKPSLRDEEGRGSYKEKIDESKTDHSLAVPTRNDGRRTNAECDARAELPSTCRGRFRHPRFQIRRRRDAARIEAALPHDRRVEARRYGRRAQRRSRHARYGRLGLGLSVEPVRRRAL